jgi:alpha-amylase/alpha-mannosidase (GH57 family)
MPYKLRKAPNRDLFWVVNTDTGHKHSIEPIPKSRAQRQLNLLRGIEHGFVPRLRGGESSERKFWENKLANVKRDYVEWIKQVETAYHAFNAEKLRELNLKAQVIKEEIDLIKLALRESK